MLLALAAYLWMPETGRPGEDSLKQYLARTSRAIREPRLTLAFATGFLRFFLDYGLYTYLPIIVALRYGASPAVIGLPDRGLGGGIDHHRARHRPRLRPHRDRDAAGAGVPRQRRSASGCRPWARRCG